MGVSSHLRAIRKTRKCLAKEIFGLDGNADAWNDERRLASSASKAVGLLTGTRITHDNDLPRTT